MQPCPRIDPEFPCTSEYAKDVQGYQYCTYCGSLHPDEFMQMLEDGKCTVEATDKNYKIYVKTKEYETKFYFYHFTNSQKQRFIELYNDNKLVFARYNRDIRKVEYVGGKFFYVLPFFMHVV